MKTLTAVLCILSLSASPAYSQGNSNADANSSHMETKHGRTGIDSEVFNKLAAKDEIRARDAAEKFKNSLRRIVALAAIYQWKAKEFDKTQDKPVKAVRQTSQ